MKKKIFYIIILLITLLSFFLRLKDYDIVPPTSEAFDEVHYAWGGATWIKEGTPRSWSNFDSYKNPEFIERYGIRWRIVKPLVEKPPLYFLLSGLTVLFFQPTNIFDISHSTIRILPLLLSIPTIFLTILVAKKVFNNQIAIIAGIIYATTPTTVLANRMSLTENLLTPFALLALLILLSKSAKRFTPAAAIAVISTLAILTKQIGVSIAIASSVIFYQRRLFKNILTILCFSTMAFLIYFAIGYFYDWKLFLSLQNDVRVGHTLSGLPESIAAIFRFPTIGPKNHPFVDGTILLGLILLFSSPLWLMKDNNKNPSKQILLIFPFAYLLLLAVGESSQTAFTFFGWYLYPLFPFLIILLAKFFWDFWKKPEVFTHILIILILGSSAVRFFFLLFDRSYQYLWQYTFILLIAVSVLIFAANGKYAKVTMFSIFILFITINLLADFNLKEIYQTVAINDKSLLGF